MSKAPFSLILSGPGDVVAVHTLEDSIAGLWTLALGVARPFDALSDDESEPTGSKFVSCVRAEDRG